MNEFKVFVDLDGVLCDFARHVKNLFGTNNLPDDKMWELVAATPDFWPTIPLKYGAHDLLAFLKPYNPIVLTGCPRNHYEVAAVHKVEWVREHFGPDLPVITCLSRNKPHYMESVGDVLIDDFSTNVRRWAQAGGRAVHYRTYHQAITDFKLVVGLSDETHEGRSGCSE